MRPAETAEEPLPHREAADGNRLMSDCVGA